MKDLAPDKSFTYKELKQLNNMDSLSSRISEINSCSSAIICWPAQDSPNTPINALMYIDLGACLARFGKQTLLIHQGAENLPNNLAVETFNHLGSLDLKRGVELARKILHMLN